MEIVGFNNDVAKDSSLVGCDAVLLSEYFLNL